MLKYLRTRIILYQHYYKGEPKEIYDTSKKEDIDNFFQKILSYHS